MAVERNPFANVINLNADPMEEAVEFEIELEDPILGRKISHRYAIGTLPNEG